MSHVRAQKQSQYSPEFFDRCASLFLGFESGHMGSDMYCDHLGVRVYRNEKGVLHTEPMSGVLTWDEHAKHGTLPRLGRQSFLANVQDVAQTIGTGLPIVEYGPGSMEDAQQLIHALDSKLYVPADLSKGVIAQATRLATAVMGCEVRPAIMDLFADDNAPLIEEPALAALLGLTITNLPGPAPAAPPRDALVRAFQNLTKPIGHSGGYLLVSTHAEQNGDRNRELYGEQWHRKFGVNFLYRMEAELPLEGFDPTCFEYTPIWHNNCGLLAHAVQATRDIDFAMGDSEEIAVSIKAGDVFHYNNSFKFEQTFFEECAKEAGLKAVRKWQDKDSLMLYLFEVPVTPQLHVIPRATRPVVSSSLG